MKIIHHMTLEQLTDVGEAGFVPHAAMLVLFGDIGDQLDALLVALEKI